MLFAAFDFDEAQISLFFSTVWVSSTLKALDTQLYFFYKFLTVLYRTVFLL
jgi:hypothetical protein